MTKKTADRRLQARWGKAKQEARLTAKVGYFSPNAKAWSRAYDAAHPCPGKGNQ